MIAPLLIALAAAQAQASEAPPPPPVEFVAGRAKLGRWRMEAVTVVEYEYPPPWIGNGRCTIAGPGLRLVRPRDYGGSFELGGVGAPFAMTDIAAIEIGGTVYEARTVPGWIPRGRYSDVDYPAGHVDPELPGPATPTLAVRQAPADPWLHIVTLLDDIAEVRSIGISYRTGGGEARTRLVTAGLGAAMHWCDRALHAPPARRLPELLRARVRG